MHGEQKASPRFSEALFLKADISLMSFSGYIWGHLYVNIKLITKLTKMLSS